MDRYDNLLRQLAADMVRIQRQATRPLSEDEMLKHIEHTAFAEELAFLLQTLETAQKETSLPGHYDRSDIKVRPNVLECDVVRFQNNKDKWIAFVGLRDGRPYEIFTGLADDEFGIALPKAVTRGKIIRMENEDGSHRYDFQFVNTRGFKTTVEGLSYKFDKEFWNYAKLISGILRYGMPIDQVIRIISSLQLDNESINSWTQGVARALKRYILDDETPHEEQS